jgi:DNA repair protein SbcD/Mre11
MHLSDLHLGKLVLEQSMIDDQKYILNQIIDIVKKEQVDIVLIAGDVYDKSIPTIEAVNLFSDFLTRLYKLKVLVFVISGNHDSKDRLSFGNELFVDNGIYIEGIFNGNLRCETINDKDGKLNIYMLPFIKPVEVKRFYPDEIIDTYDDAIKCILKHSSINKSERNIVMVHQFVTSLGEDVIRSDSESISLGGIDNIDVTLFKDFDYVAMGHIHGPQKVWRETARYSGSPLKYSFSEVNQKKSVCIIEFNSKEDINISKIPLIPIRDMRVIKGPFDKLISKEIVNLENKNDYLNVVLTDDDYIINAIGKLRKFYPNILKLEYENKISSNEVSDNIDIDKSNMSPIDLFSEFYKMQNGIELPAKKRKIIEEVIKEVNDEAN